MHVNATATAPGGGTGQEQEQDSWYDGNGMDATEASAVFGCGAAASGVVERRWWIGGAR
jgi:hypothetical protein